MIYVPMWCTMSCTVNRCLLGSSASVSALGEKGQRHVDWTESEYSQSTAMRLARAGALVRIVAAEDACEVCKALSTRTYTPSEVPRLPIRGCEREQCRCRFEAIDPESELTVSQLVERGVQAFKAKRRDLAEQMLRRAVTLDEMHELGWLWLSGVVEDSEKVVCLNKVLSINPRNKHAQAGLDAMRKKGTAPLVPQNTPAAPPAETQIQQESVLTASMSSRGDLSTLVPHASAGGDPSLRTRDSHLHHAADEVQVSTPGQSAAPPLGMTESTDSAPPAETPSLEAEGPTEEGVGDEGTADADLPELGLLHAERKVIIEQWAEFIAFAVEIDPNMLLIQAQAFLQKLGRLNRQSLDLVAENADPTARTLAELQIQWHESERIGEALAEVIDGHRARDNNAPGWQPMLDALHQLGSDVVEHRRNLREQITEAGGQTS